MAKKSEGSARKIVKRNGMLGYFFLKDSAKRLGIAEQFPVKEEIYDDGVFLRTKDPIINGFKHKIENEIKKPSVKAMKENKLTTNSENLDNKKIEGIKKVLKVEGTVVKGETNLTQGNSVKASYLENKKAEQEIKTELAKKSENYTSVPGKLDNFTQNEFDLINEAWMILVARDEKPSFNLPQLNKFNDPEKTAVLEILLRALNSGKINSIDKAADKLLRRFGWLDD